MRVAWDYIKAGVNLWFWVMVPSVESYRFEGDVRLCH